MRRTGPTSSLTAVLAVTLLLSAACASGAPAPPASRESAEREIIAMLDASAEAWSRGDLDGYIGDYAEDATFVTSGGLIRGASEIRRMYAEGYWGGPTPPDPLRFDMLDVRITGPGTATAVGRYILYDRDSGESTATGIFTLSLGRVGGAWKIFHDHSSADAS